MREFEKKKLYALINLAKEKKNETLGLFTGIESNISLHVGSFE